MIKTNSEILEQACGVSIDSIESSFDKWLFNTYKLSFLKPLSNPGAYGGEYEGISALLSFRKSINEAKTTYDSLLKANNSSADILFDAMNKRKFLYDSTVNVFENNMRKLYTQNNGHINQGELAEQAFKLIDYVGKLDRELKALLVTYKKMSQ